MADIFLSYARADDEVYARIVYERLRAADHEVWFDREAMPSRALTFLQEIRDAIRSRERLVVVLGPAAVKSDYVRAEWQAALVEGKAVTPILRLGDYDLVPPELANLHCPDVRASRPAEAAYAELLRVLSDPVPAVGALHGLVPEMPPHFQPSPDALSALAATLLYDIEHPVVVEGPLRSMVLHGMGGVGKSVLAAAFARSFTARRVFGDGVYWLTASPGASVLDLVRRLLNLAGMTVTTGTGLDAAITALRHWLDGRRCLIVIDNVWLLDQAAPFAQALSTVSRLLLTTRDAGIATGLGAHASALDVLTPETALRYLADWVGVAVEALPAEAPLVAAECGHLPFALALQGALARDGVPWPDLLHALRDAELDYAEQKFAAYPYPHVLAALRVSVEELRSANAQAAAHYGELVAFIWEEGVPEAAVLRLWGHGEPKLAAHQGRKLLATLQSKSLLQLEGTAPARRVRLHDLMVDYLVATRDAKAANAKLVEAYRAACQTDWPDGPDDGYFLEHLLDHLARLTDAGAELQRLLRLETADGRHAWFAAIDAAGRVEAFRRQLNRQLARPEIADADALRFVLLLASITAQAARMPANLLEALVKHGVWSAARALDYARQLPLASPGRYGTEPGARMRALLAVMPHLPAAARSGVLEEALAAAHGPDEEVPAFAGLAGALATAGRSAEALPLARRARHGDGRTSALAAIAAHATGAERETLIAEALHDAATTLDLFRTAALEPLLPLLDAAGLDTARAQAVEPLPNPMVQGWCLRDMVSRLLEVAPVAAAQAVAAGIAEPVSRAEALALLLPQLAPAEREQCIAEILQTMSQIGEARWRRQIVAAFAELPAPFQSVLPTLFVNSTWRPEVLGKLAPYLQGQTLTDALTLVRETNDAQFLGAGAEALAPILSAPDRARLLTLAIERARALTAGSEQARVVASIAPALEVSDRTALIGDILTAIESMPSGEERHEALLALAPALSATDAARALSLARQTPEPYERIAIVEALLPALPANQLPAARGALDAIDDRTAILFAAAALSRGAPEEVQQELLQRAAAEEEYHRARALALLLPHIDDGQVEEAVQCIATIDDAGSLAEVALPALARRVSEPRRSDVLRQAIQVAATIKDAERLAWAFEAFRDLLTPALLDEALAAFATAELGFGDEWRQFGRARYLIAALPVLPAARCAAVRDEIVALLPSLPEASLRRDLLGLLAPQTDVGDYETLVQLVEKEQDAYERGITAGFLIDDAPPALRPRLVEAALAEVVEIKGSEFASATERAERAAARVMAYTHDPHHALAMIARFESESWKPAALLGFARAQHEGLLDDVLAVTSELADAGDRATVLLALAEQAPAERREALLQAALLAAMADRSDLLHDDMLPKLVATLVALPAARALALWRTARLRLGELDRPQLLAKLHWLAPAILHADGASGPAVVAALLAVARWWP